MSVQNSNSHTRVVACANYKQVLFVEDSPLILKTYETYANKFKWVDPCFAKNQKEALEVIDEHRSNFFDSVVTDYQLGDGNSDVVIRKIRDISKSVPILLVTSNLKETDEVSELRQFNIFYQEKPLTKETLRFFLRRGSIKISQKL